MIQARFKKRELYILLQYEFSKNERSRLAQIHYGIALSVIMVIEKLHVF